MQRFSSSVARVSCHRSSSSIYRQEGTTHNNANIVMLTPSPTVAVGQKMPPGARNLQDKLHLLLSKLSSTIEIVKTWPESEGDDASIHVATTTKLISSLLEVISGLKNVEGVVKSDNELRKALQACPVSINLLDLLDHGGGSLNPDCFSRGLLRESLGQLKGLRRRKLALKMLGEAVNSGLGSDPAKGEATNKRKLSDPESKQEEDLLSQPSTKKARTANDTDQDPKS